MRQTAAGVAWQLDVHEVLPSTSDFCRARAEQGDAEGLAVMARRQSAGRGSRGRNWSTPPGNLAISVLLRPDLAVREAAQMSLLAGVALAEALTGVVPPGAQLALKWPNDLLLNGGKLAGILLDSRADRAGRLEWLVVGIGVNLATAPAVPDRLTACLADVMPAPAPETVAKALLGRLAHWYGVLAEQGFAPMRTAWLAHAQPPGSAMTLRLAEGRVAGKFAGLGEDGSLLLAAPDGVHRYSAGEVLLHNEG